MSTGANHVSSYQELKDRQAHAAVAISGAHHSSWNGHQFVVDPREEYSGIARWEGSIGYKDDRVNEPLREMFEYAGHYNQPRRRCGATATPSRRLCTRTRIC
jgi:hypothetical protein